MKKFIVAAIALFLVFGTSFSGKSNLCAKEKPTPYAVLLTTLEAHSFETTDVTLETVVPDLVLQEVTPELKKSFRIKREVNYPEHANLSEILVSLMNAKYGTRNNKKADFYRIQYSLHSDDFAQYLEKYPNSKFIDEVQSKMACTKRHEEWKAANRTGSRNAYQIYSQENVDYNNACAYEGYKAIAQADIERARAIEAWLSLLEVEAKTLWLTDNIVDCDVYSDYIETHKDYSCFLAEAQDSLSVCMERNAWLEAEMQNTLESYREYLETYPRGKHIRQARRKVDDGEAWLKARQSDTYYGYCEYYNDYPEGDSIAIAAEIIKQKEAEWWANAQKKNTVASYDDFIDRFPNGYYSSEAKNRAGELRLNKVKDEKATINELAEAGAFSQLGYSLVGLCNLDKSVTMTVSLIGTTGEKVVLKHGEYKWVKVKNGKYKILVQASGHENWWGNVEFENKIYADGWYSVTQTSRWDYLDPLSRFQIKYDKEVYDKFSWEIVEKVLEEKAKLRE